MNILYLTNKPIFPLVDGGCIAMHQFLKSLLKAGYNVKNWTISTSKHPFKEDHFPEKLRSIILPENFELNTTVTPFNATLSFFKSSSFNIDRFYNKEFEEKIINYISENEIEIVIFESIYFANYISSIKKKCTAKLILRSHNVEFEIWKKLAQNEKNKLKKIYLKKLSSDLKKVELTTLPLFDGVLCISKNDRIKFQELIPTINYATIPIALEEENRIADYTKNHFFHIGSMNWQPNKEAVNWLIESIFPKIKAKIPEAKLILAGSNMSKSIQSNPNKGIEVIGYVKDVTDFMVSNGIMIVPLKSGSGVRVKLLEGMNLGVPIITTSQGAEGIDKVLKDNSKTLVIVDNEDLIVEKAIELFHSEEKRKEIGQNALHLIRQKYQIEAVTNKLIEFIKHIS